MVSINTVRDGSRGVGQRVKESIAMELLTQSTAGAPAKDHASIESACRLKKFGQYF